MTRPTERTGKKSIYPIVGLLLVAAMAALLVGCGADGNRVSPVDPFVKTRVDPPQSIGAVMQLNPPDPAYSGQATPAAATSTNATTPPGGWQSAGAAMTTPAASTTPANTTPPASASPETSTGTRFVTGLIGPGPATMESFRR